MPTEKAGGLSTGLDGLDRLLTGLRAGDNVIFQADTVGDYSPFVTHFLAGANRLGRKAVYFRFARHEPLAAPGPGVEVHEFSPEDGFEAFVSGIHHIVRDKGRGGYYIFDLLSDLAADWYSDQMLANFFTLTCPYLFDIGALAYFSLLRGHHSPETVGSITGTAQVLLDVFRHAGRLHVLPVKADQRHAPAMFMLHSWQDDGFMPVSDSATVSEVMASTRWPGLGDGSRQGLWEAAFAEAEAAVADGRARGERAESPELLSRLLRMTVSRDERMLRLATAHLTLEDLVQMRRRMIGSGLIGGKSVGMLVARAILRKRDPRWASLLEPHDSFYVGSDVYYTFVVGNGLWWERERQKDPGAFLAGAEEARRRMAGGALPAHAVKQFEAMLDYFGQSPIIVRSSSLLEDNFGNSFAGKYDSVFCANQGTREERLEKFLSAVRTVYASTMSEKALTYRSQRGLLGRDEQMALLVQRVSGRDYEGLFYPQVAGVGLSYNPWAWSEYIEPAAGALRLVFGLGTRAVERSDDDYTRVVALNAPLRRPESGIDELRHYSQRRVDFINLGSNRLDSGDFSSVARDVPGLPISMFASRQSDLERRSASPEESATQQWVLTFERLLGESGFVADMRRMLSELQAAYDYPVETEFTANFHPDGSCLINLVQCRPLQVRGEGAIAELPQVPPERVLVEAKGAVIGRSRTEAIDRLIYVVPAVYAGLTEQRRHEVAGTIGRIVHHGAEGRTPKLMLIGPGRWGTTTPSLGVPVSFHDIDRASVLCEIVAMRDGLVPDVSLGTHFFNELVEQDMLYLALFPSKEGNRLNEGVLGGAPNRLAELVPEDASLADVIRVIDADQLSRGGAVMLNANALLQRVTCYLEPAGMAGAVPVPGMAGGIDSPAARV